MRAWLLLLAACASSPPSSPLDEAFDAVAGVSDVTSVALRQDGVAVREAYYRDTDADTPHDVRSVTKTVTSLLIGAAIDSGCLTSLDQTLGELLGEQAPTDPAKAAIRVRDLLTMTSGFDWSELGSLGYSDWATAQDQVQYVLARPLVAQPGTVFTYNSGALHLLSVILTRACAPTAEFAAQHLFGPLGIASRPWETDNQGFTNGAAGIQLSTAELVTIGQLLLDHGQFHGASIVSAAYVDMATSQQIATTEQVGNEVMYAGYGFGIWTEVDAGGAPFATAQGYGGQFIVVVPRARAVIVVTTNWHGVMGVDRNFVHLLSILIKEFVPAL
jgi:CubicO group peptidase (beta-lactamase class C family)